MTKPPTNKWRTFALASLAAAAALLALFAGQTVHQEASELVHVSSSSANDAWNRKVSFFPASLAKGGGDEGEGPSVASHWSRRGLNRCRIGCADLGRKRSGGAPQFNCASFFPIRFFNGLGREFEAVASGAVSNSEHGARFMILLQNKSASDEGVGGGWKFSRAAVRTRGVAGEGDGKCQWEDSVNSATYIHVHKNGGTSVANALSAATLTQESGFLRKYSTFKYDFAKERKRYRTRYDDDHMRLMRVLHQRQTKNVTAVGRRESKHVIFTFVRDPVERFLSSAGQVLHMEKHFLNNCNHSEGEGKRGETATAKSSEEKARDVLRCAIRTVQSGPEWDYRNTHFLPQAIEMYQCAAGYDVEVQVFRMSLLPKFLRGLGWHPNATARSATGKKYTGGYELSLDTLTDDMVRDICELYRVDVIMLRSLLGMPTSCDDILF